MSDETIAEKARAYRARGWAPLPLCARGKAPSVGDRWESFVASDVTVFDGNVGVILGARSGGLGDIDIDCDEARLLAPLILPPTDAVFGRRSCPRAHWVYLCAPPPEATKPFPDTKKSADAKQMLVELRATGQTMFPPSVHPSGERVEWASEAEPRA